MTRFVVDLGDISLPKEVHAAINADIQKVALGHLAGLGFSSPYVFKFPQDWLGLIIRKDFEAMLEGEQMLQRGLLQTMGRM